MQYRCHICGKYGPWKLNHSPDCSIPSHVMSFNAPSTSNAHRSLSSNYAYISDHDLEGKDKWQKMTVSFTMETLNSSSASIRICSVEPLLNRACTGTSTVLHNWLNALNGHTHCQYGICDYASPARRILRSIVITATFDRSRPLCTTYVVIYGSSQWVIGRNVTRNANIEHIGKNALVFLADGQRDQIFIVNDDFLSFISMDCSTSQCKNGSTLSCLSSVILDSTPWCEVKKIIDQVHKRVYGHAGYTDYNLLLERNGIWNDMWTTCPADSKVCCQPRKNWRVMLKLFTKGEGY